LENFRDTIQDQPDLVLRDAHDQNAAGVRLPLLGPLAQEGREVTEIERHHDQTVS
jgi:hypothetical protein